MALSDDQNIWNAVFTVGFVVFFVGLVGVLYKFDSLPTQVSLFDAAVLALASFRLTRLFVYDKIFRFVRDLFLVHPERYSEQGVTYVASREHVSGPLRTISELLACPWCFSMWAALVVSFFYFLTPLSWFPIFVLALAGVVGVIQVVANGVGWWAENGKLRAQSGSERGL